MNNKGFTLSELIVTIAIMGIITMIAYPAIDKLQKEHEQELYRTYEKALETGAKLYYDKYARDMFYDGKLCYIVTYNTLEKEKFVKEYKRNKVNMNKNKTYVEISDNGKVYKAHFEIDGKHTTQYKSECPNTFPN